MMGVAYLYQKKKFVGGGALDAPFRALENLARGVEVAAPYESSGWMMGLLAVYVKSIQYVAFCFITIY